MPTSTVHGRGLFACVLLALAAALSLAGESAAHSIAVEASSAEPVVVVTGTVTAIVIEDRINNTTTEYRELRQDDGTTTTLHGIAAEALLDGARVEISGRRMGAALDVANSQPLASTQPSGPVSAPVEIEGTLAIAHGDDFVTGNSRYFYQVHDDSGAATALAVAALPHTIRGGSRVLVVGRRGTDASLLYPQRITILAEPPRDSSGEPSMFAKAATVNTVLVIMANFNDTTAPAFTQAQAQAVMTTNASSVSNYYSEVSYGQQLLNVTVTPTWVTMNMASSPTCDWSTIGTNAEAAATAAGYNPANYTFVVYMFPSLGSCGWSGLAYVGFPKKAWINGPNSFITLVVAHEMGHNFGLFHAGSLSCGAATIGGSCGVAEYGDPWDTMGNQRAMHFNAIQKQDIGFIASSTVKVHGSGSANYTLSPIEQGGGALYSVLIGTSNPNRTYSVEFRQPIGFDAALASYPNNGAQLRLVGPFEWSSGADDTEILDMTPGSGSGFLDSALVAGNTYTDATYGVSITVTSASANALNIHVTKAGGAATATTLTSSRNPSTVGTSVTFTASVTGTSPTGSVNFTDGAASIAGCSAAALAGSGNTRTATCATGALAGGIHSIVATYGGDATNAGSSSAALSQTVNKATSTTGVGTSLTPSTAGTGVTFTATVSGTAPTGTVNFKDGASSIAGCSAAALAGAGNIRTATCATSSLPTGTHSMTAAYSGDATNNGSTSGVLSQVVNKVASSTTLSSSGNPVAPGANVTFTASVSGFAPTGAVNFTDGGTSISGCSAVALAGNANIRTAVCSTNSLAAGAHNIVAAYGGDADNIASASPSFSQNISSAAPPASLVNASFETPALGSGFQYNPSGAGIGWTFSASSGIQHNGSAWGAAAAPNGVQTAFVQSTGSISQALNLNAGNYTLAFQAAQRPCCLTPNTQPIKVSLDGIQIGNLVSPGSTSFGNVSIAFTVASSGTHTLAFTGTNPNSNSTFIDAVSLTAVVPGTTLASSLNPAKLNKSVSFTATVTGTNPTGTVAFTSNGSPISGCTAVGFSGGSGNVRTAQCVTSFAATGSFNIVANYSGNGGNAPTSSAPLVETVKSKG